MTEELEQLKQIFIDSYEVDLPIKNLDSPFELIDKISNQVQTKVIPNGMVTGGNRYIIQGLIFLRDYYCNVIEMKPQLLIKVLKKKLKK